MVTRGRMTRADDGQITTALVKTVAVAGSVTVVFVGAAAAAAQSRMRRSWTNLFDAVVVVTGLMVLVLICSGSCTCSPMGDVYETFDDGSPAYEEDANWAQGLSTSGNLVNYISVFRTDSCSGSDPSLTWANVATGLAPSQCPGQTPIDLDFTFNNIPVWTASTGYELTNIILTGPNSMDVFKQTRAFTVFCLFQLTGLPSDGSAATLLFIPANGSPSQNGLSLGLSAIGSPTGSSIRASVTLAVGNQAVLLSGDNGNPDVHGVMSVAFDSNARYLIAITRSSVSARVSIFHVESSSAKCSPNVVLSAQVIDDALVYNNQAIIINGNGGARGGGLTGNIMAFGMFDAALTQQDEKLICSHYHDALLQQDPLVQLAMSTAASAKAAIACPYDDDTCELCSSVTSWTNPFHVAVGGADCMNAIDMYCTNNPTSTGCECYDPNNMSSATRRTCQAIKSMYSGDDSSMCASQVQRALISAETTRSAITEAKQHEDDGAHRCDSKPDEGLPRRPTFFAWLFGL